MIKINKGDTVRFSVEGVVEVAESAYVTINGKSYAPKYFDVEVLKKAAPVWSNGDVVLETSFNIIWVRRNGKWSADNTITISDSTVNTYVETGMMEILRQQATND